MSDFPLLAAQGKRRIHAFPSALNVGWSRALCASPDAKMCVDPRTVTDRPSLFADAPPAKLCALCVMRGREAGAL
jgi:hypothetical protein